MPIGDLTQQVETGTQLVPLEIAGGTGSPLCAVAVIDVP
jgi:hypothetical protein